MVQPAPASKRLEHVRGARVRRHAPALVRAEDAAQNRIQLGALAQRRNDALEVLASLASCGALLMGHVRRSDPPPAKPLHVLDGVLEKPRLGEKSRPRAFERDRPLLRDARGPAGADGPLVLVVLEPGLPAVQG